MRQYAIGVLKIVFASPAAWPEGVNRWSSYLLKLPAFGAGIRAPKRLKPVSLYWIAEPSAAGQKQLFEPRVAIFFPPVICLTRTHPRSHRQSDKRADTRSRSAVGAQQI